jgi:AAA15 family ATPase/GTPase
MHPGPVTGIFLNSRGRTTNEEDINFFSQMRIKQRDSLLLRAVQLIEPRLEHLEILSPQGTTLIYGHLKGYSDLVPFPLLGDGTRRLASLILAISAAQGGVVLVDEIENGIHHAIMVDMWAVVAEAATQFNTQVFATTHSQECVAAAHEAFLKREQYRFRLHRLDRLNGEIEAATYDHESLEGALSIPLEVRG